MGGGVYGIFGQSSDSVSFIISGQSGKLFIDDAMTLHSKKSICGVIL